MAFVQKSILTLALGLDRMQRATCPSNKVGLCPEMLPVNGSILLQHLMNVSFSFLNEDVYFDELGDPPGKYEILNFRRREESVIELNNDNDHEDKEEEDEEDEDEVDGLTITTTTTTTSTTTATRPSLYDDRLEFNHLTINGPSSINRSLLSPSFNLSSKIKDSYLTFRVNRTAWPTAPRASISNSRSTSRLKSSVRNTRTISSLYGLQLSDRRHARGSRGRKQKKISDNIKMKKNNNNNRNQNQNHEETEYQYEYAVVGSWSSNEKLNLLAPIKWPAALDSDTPGTPPRSVCSLPCAKGHAKVGNQSSRFSTLSLRHTKYTYKDRYIVDEVERERERDKLELIMNSYEI